MSKYETEYEGWEWIDGGWARGYENVITDLDLYDEMYDMSDAEIEYLTEQADQDEIKHAFQDFSI